MPVWEVHFNRQARAGSFFARDNIHNFIRWCNELGVLDCLMFETEDLVSRKNEKHVILCLLEIARRGAKFGMAAPILVQFEQQIDREIARDEEGGDDSARDQEPPAIMVYGPNQQVVTNDLKSLDEMVSTDRQAHGWCWWANGGYGQGRVVDMVTLITKQVKPTGYILIEVKPAVSIIHF